MTPSGKQLIQFPTMIVIVMGVTGAGKTTVGRLLAAKLGWEFADADDFHPAANVEKMRRGIALGDDDRRPWLERLRVAINEWIAAGKNVVLACSALKRSYREILDGSSSAKAGPAPLSRGTGRAELHELVRFIYLKGSAGFIAERLRERAGHFAGEQILAGQFADLEEPEGAVTVDVSSSPDQIVAEIRQKLGLA